MQGLFHGRCRIGEIYLPLTVRRYQGGMKQLCLLAFLLCACASASPEFRGVSPVLVQRGGFDIQVWRRGNRAQAIRMGYANRNAQGELRAHMLAAIEAVTLCQIDMSRVAGDTGVLNAGLKCPASD